MNTPKRMSKLCNYLNCNTFSPNGVDEIDVMLGNGIERNLSDWWDSVINYFRQFLQLSTLYTIWVENRTKSILL